MSYDLTPPKSGSPATTLPVRLSAARVVAQPARGLTTRREDIRNLLIIVAAWALLLIIVPYQHDYPTTDDYIYAGSVQDLLRTGQFHMPDMSQANLVGLTVWGTLWSKLFGFSMTTLTVSTLFLAVVALAGFYGIMRVVGIGPSAALLGTGLLGFNPIFIHVAYSFMTDVPFLALNLCATYCYLRGTQGQGWRGGLAWLALGGLLAGWAYLIRQYGVLVPATFVLYLVVEGALARKWRWQHLLLTIAIPAAIVIWHLYWSRDFPVSSATAMASVRSANFVLKEPWMRVFFLRMLAIMPLTAFCACGAVRIRKGRRWLIPVIGIAMLWGMYALDLPNETWLDQQEPQFTATLGPFSYVHPNEPYSFGLYGNIVRVTGMDFDEFEYTQAKIWSPEAWRLIFMLGVGLAAVLLAAIAAAFFDWAQGLWRKWRARKESPFELRSMLTPIGALYTLGVLTFVISLAFPGDLFDRYTLAFVPFFIIFVVRGARNWRRWAWAYSVGALAVLAAFTVLGEADYMDHSGTRWNAALWMEARVGQVRAGWNWDHWGHQGSDSYIVDDVMADGFRLENRFAYTCRLCGFQTRYVLAQSRDDMPPLPRLPR